MAAEPSIALADGAGRTVRSILATEFDVAPEAVPEYLRSESPIDRLNAAIDAIESSRERLHNPKSMVESSSFTKHIDIGSRTER